MGVAKIIIGDMSWNPRWIYVNCDDALTYNALIHAVRVFKKEKKHFVPEEHEQILDDLADRLQERGFELSQVWNISWEEIE